MGILQNIFGFIIAIGVLVAFHEFGHYWVARRLGVKVLRYSIGFGKPLVIWRRGPDNTEYAISAIPLGGYVKMLDEREGPVAPEELHRAFNRQSLGVRAAIVAAGPLFNLLFAVLAYWFVFVSGTQELRAYLGEPLADTPAAAAGFQRGDEVLAVDGDPVKSWDQLLLTLLDAGVDRAQVSVQVLTRDGQQAIRQLDLSGIRALGDEQDFMKVVGLRMLFPDIPAVIAGVRAGSAADAAGLKAGERVVAIDGQPVDGWKQMAEYLAARPGQQVTLSLTGADGARTVTVTLGTAEVQGRTVGQLGVEPAIFREVRYDPLAALPRAVEETWLASSLTLKVLYKMLVGDASIKNLSGPLNIAQIAGQSVELGLSYFVKFLAIVSVSLAVLNLLPVPVLDGGHLFYYALEAVRGRPLSERAQQIGQQIGVAMLLLLMTIAFYNDITRLLVQ